MNERIAVPGVWLLAAVTVLLLGVRLWLDDYLELMFDEAYYALWAQHLAWCYLDHPPMVAVWIRLSTALFGHDEFGVRALGTFAAAGGSAFVYLLSLRLFECPREAAFAGLLYCAMLLVGAGAIIMTPDTPLLLFWSIAVYAVIRVYGDDGWPWWLIAGAAMGLALQSKYTALLLGGGIVLSMITVPRMRRWWAHPAPYVAGLLSFAIFAPVIVWNYRHHWASFAKQFDRVEGVNFSLRYVGELLGSQVGLLTPFVFLLAVAAIYIVLAMRSRASEPGLLLVSLIGPLLVYFLFHSLHARVQGNWTAPAYPGLAVLAAHAAFSEGQFARPWRSTIAISRRYALPVGFSFAVLAYLQAAFGVLPLDPAKDPTALMAGWSDLARQLDDIAQEQQASFVLTSGYALTSLLTVYAHATPPVIQFNERSRWLSFKQPSADLFAQRGLYVSEIDKDQSQELARRFANVQRVGALVRLRGTEMIKQYVVYSIGEPIGPVLSAAGE